MRVLAIALLLAAPTLAQLALAQPAQTIVPALPSPAVDDDSSPLVFLLAAKQAINDGKADLAMEALERAESRALGRSVKPSLANQPSEQIIVGEISAARRALAAGDKAAALDRISNALAADDT